MPVFDLPLQQLQDYLGEIPEPADYDEFWDRTVSEAGNHELVVTCHRYPTPWTFETWDLEFAGYGGSPVKAWLTLPAGATEPLPAVIQYHGYSVGRSFPHTAFTWAAAGYAHLSMDNRGQGYHQGGPTPSTPDPFVEAGLPHTPGFLTLGIANPETYYYRRLYVDGLRLLQATATLPQVDPTRIALTGASQGGAITLAVAGLAPRVGAEVVGIAPDVPAFCNYPRALDLTAEGPWFEIHQYLAGWRDQVAVVRRTLSYFDLALMVERATAPALFSVGMMDTTIPPSTVYAGFNRYGRRSPSLVHKDIRAYEFSGHEGGGPHHVMVQAEFLAGLFERNRP